MSENMARSNVATFPSAEPACVALLERIVQGDQAAFAALYDATSATVYGLALRILREPEAAEDVTLDVYMQAYRHAASYDAQRGTPLAWLLTLTRSRAIDCQRRVYGRQQREAPLEMGAQVAAATLDPETSTVAGELRLLVQQALTMLSPEQRRVIETAYYSDLSHTEVAAQLGQPLGTVKTRIRTGMVALRKLLSPLLDEEATGARYATPYGVAGLRGS